LRLNEDAKRQKALDLAKSPNPRDEITQRAIDLQKSSGFFAQRAEPRTAARTAGDEATRR
jgi:hypothetical protein